MNTAIRKLLIETARIEGHTISYSTLNEQCELGYDFSLDYHRKMIGEDLGELSEYEHKAGRPLLSALVVHKGSNYEGDGFYRLCENLGFGDAESLKRNRKTFDAERKQECYDFWSDEENYKKFKNI